MRLSASWLITKVEKPLSAGNPVPAAWSSDVSVIMNGAWNQWLGQMVPRVILGDCSLGAQEWRCLLCDTSAACAQHL